MRSAEHGRRIARRAQKASLARAVLALATTALLAAPPLAGADPGASAALNALLRHPALRGARVGIAVEDLESGEARFGRDADLVMVPASNQKLITAAAALAHWGPSYRFETPVLTTAPIDSSGVLDGALWIAGRGDPSIVSESLWRLAEELRLRGLTEVRGGLGIDTSYFDGERFHSDWGVLGARAYQAPTSAFAANYSSFRVEVTPGLAPGSLATLRSAPSIPYLRLQSDARTQARGGRLVLDVQPLPDGAGELVRTRGSVSARSEGRTYWRSVRFPELYAGSILRSQLEAHGIRVRGSLQLGPTPPEARELFCFKGEPLAMILRDLNKFSNNFVAEELTKGLGASTQGPPGTWERGAAALANYLRSIGVRDEQFVIADGSGLSPRNRVSPAVLVHVLRTASRRLDSGPEFLASLPIGGVDGTLERRLDPELPVRGKTGHLRHVGSLSGVIPDASGRPLAFSILVNGARGGALDVDAAIDEFLVRMRSEVGSPAREARAR